MFDNWLCGEGGKNRFCGVRWFLQCKYTHHDRFKATSMALLNTLLGQMCSVSPWGPVGARFTHLAVSELRCDLNDLDFQFCPKGEEDKSCTRHQNVWYIQLWTGWFTVCETLLRFMWRLLKCLCDESFRASVSLSPGQGVRWFHKSLPAFIPFRKTPLHSPPVHTRAKPVTKENLSCVHTYEYVAHHGAPSTGPS